VWVFPACEKKRSELRAHLRTSTPADLTIAQVLTQISNVVDAFPSWKVIRNEDLAQDFLIHLLVKDR
jgi:hypothetical protein